MQTAMNPTGGEASSSPAGFLSCSSAAITFLRMLTAAGFFRCSLVFVLVTDPILRGFRIFIAALRSEVQEVVGGVHQVDATRVRRVGAVDIAVLIAIKRAHALTFIDVHGERREVVDRLAALA